MTITNGYTTLQNVKDLLNPLGLATQATDDAVIERMVEGVSRWIDSETGRTFYARTTTTRIFDAPLGMTLYLDDDLLSIDSGGFVNGDDTTIAASEYILLPANETPKYAIRLKSSTTVTWEDDANGNTEQIIDVTGSWGYSTTAPHDIRGVCEIITVNLYRNRYGQNNSGAATITGAGVVITPKDVPDWARATLQNYKRYTAAA